MRYVKNGEYLYTIYVDDLYLICSNSAYACTVWSTMHVATL